LLLAVAGERRRRVKGEGVLREEREEESERVRLRMAVRNGVGSEKREYLKGEEEARGESVVRELPHPRLVVVIVYL